MNHEIREYSQWFPGIQNNVADTLSREIDLSDVELTNLLHLSIPSRVPANFDIVPLPNEIVSWLTSLLLQLPVQERYREEHKKTTLGLGIAGTSTASPPDLSTMSILRHSPVSRKSNSSEPLQLQLETPDLRETLQLPWLCGQSKVPSVTWSCPFGAKDIPIQHETAMDC